MPGGRLIVEGRGNWAYTFWLGNHSAVRIGRASTNDLSLPDLAVSSVHTEIVREGERYLVRDLGSSNGTFLNGAKVQSSLLKDGDEIRIGATIMSFLDDATRGERLGDPHSTSAPDISQAADSSLQPLLDKMDEISSSLKTPAADSTLNMAEELKKFRAEMLAARTELSRAKREIEALTLQNSLYRLLNSPAPESQRLESALGFIASQTEAENGFVMMVNPTTRKWVVRARYGDIRDWVPGEGAPPMSLSVVEHVIQTGESLFSDQLISDVRLMDAMSVARLQIRASMCVAIHDGSGVCGVLYVDRRESTEPFSKEKQELLEAFAKTFSEGVKA